MKDELGGVQIVGQETQPNLEEIAKLKPDLIIASKIRHEEVYEQLSSIAPTIVHETVEDFKETVDMMGHALYKETEAQKKVEEWDKRVIDFKEKLQVKLGDEAR